MFELQKIKQLQMFIVLTLGSDSDIQDKLKCALANDKVIKALAELMATFSALDKEILNPPEEHLR